MVEIRYREHFVYHNDYAGYMAKTPVAVFEFTLNDLEALESWVPWADGFHKEIMEAIEELRKKSAPLPGRDAAGMKGESE